MELIKKYLAKLACCHKWFVHKETRVWDVSFGKTEYPTYSIQILICEHCGKIKKIKTA